MLAGTLRGTPPEQPAGEGAWRAYYDAYRERGLPRAGAAESGGCRERGLPATAEIAQ
jgi:hypothetical protein